MNTNISRKVGNTELQWAFHVAPTNENLKRNSFTPVSMNQKPHVLNNNDDGLSLNFTSNIKRIKAN